MCAEKKDMNETEACCDPKEFQGMFEMMNRCCAGKKVAIDCSAMMEMMKQGGCCVPETEKQEADS